MNPIFLIHCHDLGRLCPGYGRSMPWMPTLTAFAEEATVFERAYATSPLCSPARGSLMTGRYPHSHGLMGLTHRGWKLPDHSPTLPGWFRHHGWISHLVGVQHERPPNAIEGYDSIHQFTETSGHAAPTVAMWAAREINASRHADRPPFFSIGFFEPHRERGLLPIQDPAVAALWNAPLPYPMHNRPGENDDFTGFLNACQNLDAGIAEVFDAIRGAGWWESAWIIFTTDHGIPFPRSKSTLYEAGTGVALLIKPPAGSGRPERVRALASHIDLFPTLCDACNLPTPPNLQGVSLLPALDGHSVRTHVFCEKNYHSTYDPIRSVRDDQFLLIRNFLPGHPVEIPTDIAKGSAWSEMSADPWPSRPEIELYHPKSDPNQIHNLAQHPEFLSARNYLINTLQNWMTSTADPLLQGPIPLPKRGAPNSNPCQSH